MARYDFEAVLTKYESAKLISTRIRELEANRRPLLLHQAQETLYELAQRELVSGKLLHLAVIRPSPTGDRVHEMKELLEISRTMNG